MFEHAYGYPVARVDNVYDVVDFLGIRPWEASGKPFTLEFLIQLLENLQGAPELEPAQEAEKLKNIKLIKRALTHIPEHVIAPLLTPDDKQYLGVITQQKSWAMTIAPIDDGERINGLPNPLIPLVAEYKVGGNRLAISPPAGLPIMEEMSLEDPYEAAAKREFEEEFGIELVSVERLGLKGVPIACRNNSALSHLFFGQVKLPIERSQAKLDDTEVVGGFLMRLFDWVEHLYANGADELSASAITLSAMVHMGTIWLPKAT